MRINHAMFAPTTNDYPGKLIVFEGVDGAGKTTLLEKTRLYLDQKQIKYTAI